MNFGIACPHILNVTNEVHESCWKIQWWKEYNFHYRREGTSDEANKLWEELAFEKPMYPGVCYECAEPSQYPVLSNPAVPLEKFLAVKNAPTPVVLNYSQEMIDTALARIAAKAPPAGMSQDVTYAKGHVIEEAEDFEFGGNDDGDSGDDDEKKPPADDDIYHVLDPLVKEISKREQQLTEAMKEFLAREVGKLVQLAQSNAVGRFNPPSMDDDDDDEDDDEDGAEMDGEVETDSDDDHMDDGDPSVEKGWTSLSYAQSSHLLHLVLVQWSAGC